ncbi:hypothetical protein DERP_001699 [Dermatophagoides pteronyssinus]|uniref:Uncharacterized protein n=1 Tax=Dermatophagoides pteronyssinus TaxID=6956 RepID=A0ABQ8JB95_DERPT|nr:hypothetical protein DERP_001699 [Dermatophagoides pteronyssinus]
MKYRKMYSHNRHDEQQSMVLLITIIEKYYQIILLQRQEFPDKLNHNQKKNLKKTKNLLSKILSKFNISRPRILKLPRKNNAGMSNVRCIKRMLTDDFGLNINAAFTGIFPKLSPDSTRYFDNKVANIIFSSCKANFCPIQLRDPAENGTNANGFIWPQ